MKILKTLAFLFSTGTILFSQITPYNAKISNIAIITGINVPTTRTVVYSNCQAIIGGRWIGQNDLIVSSAGAFYTNTTYLTNLGNANFAFRVGVKSNYISSPPAWRWTLITNNIISGLWFYGTNSGINIFINSGTSKKIGFVVYITNTATIVTQRWRLRAVQSAGPVPVNITSYTGDNGFIYGGTWGRIKDINALNISASGDLFGDGTHIYSLAIGTPVIIISKTIFKITLNGAISSAIPGATVTFNIFVSNSGGASANGIMVRDFMPTNYMVYVGGSMTNTKYAFTTNVGPQIIQWSKTTPLAPSESFNLRFKAIIK